jgi:phosphatidate cytidylyltransferase
MTSFWSRIVIGAALLPVVLGLVWLGGWWMFALVAVGALLALHEFAGMTKRLAPLMAAAYLGAALALVGERLGGVDWMVGGFLSTLVFAFLLKGIAATRPPTTVSVGVTVLGVAWIALGLGYAMLLRDIPEHGRLAAFTVLIAVWAGDTFAYFGGRLLGRHKLAPRTSPGKTWEGFAVGTLATIFVCFVALYDQNWLPIWESVVLGAVIAVAGPIGDLFESAIKRDMEVKDSGRVLGGHGGMLDRVDAILFASVASYYTLLAFNAFP